MTITSYETKEQTADGFRAIVVTPFEQGSGRVDFVTADDDLHVIALDDLAFLVRAAASLPRHLLEPTALAQVDDGLTKKRASCTISIPVDQTSKRLLLLWNVHRLQLSRDCLPWT